MRSSSKFWRKWENLNTWANLHLNSLGLQNWVRMSFASCSGKKSGIRPGDENATTWETTESPVQTDYHAHWTPQPDSQLAGLNIELGCRQVLVSAPTELIFFLEINHNNISASNPTWWSPVGCKKYFLLPHLLLQQLQGVSPSEMSAGLYAGMLQSQRTLWGLLLKKREGGWRHYKAVLSQINFTTCAMQNSSS